MPQDQDYDPRSLLIHSNIEKIEMSFIRSLQRGNVDPLVIMLDLRDPVARAIAERTGQGERVAEMLARKSDFSILPVLLLGLSQIDAIEITAGFFPNLDQDLNRLVSGEGYCVVAIAFGGAIIQKLRPVVE